MTTPSRISERFWNRPEPAELEYRRESINIDDLILKSHTEREILTNLCGIKTVFDGGAGWGRFSVMLAKMGLEVTHFDISQAMIDKAKEIAAHEGVFDKITFITGSLDDLTRFTDKQFDMVLSFDSPISYTYPNHGEVIKNLMRICRKRMIISVYNRAGGGMLHIFNPQRGQAYLADTNTEPKKIGGDFIPNFNLAARLLETGLFEDSAETVSAHEQGKLTWPISYSFTADELLSVLYKNGAKSVNLAGPGALLRSIPREVLMNIISNEETKAEFLDFCYKYDSQPHCEGMGMTNILANVILN
jgi:2-polyprenyl-3-methyl-5-hydroxy-6-metoxy-1,4-benzoquinol methylase